MPTCTRDSFVSGASCYRNLTLHQRKAMLIYINVLELKATGGTDYTSALTTTLVDDAKCLKNLTLDQIGRKTYGTADLVVATNNAVNAGASVSTDLHVLIAAATCLFNFPTNMLDAMILNVTCQLGVHKHYPQ